MGARTRKKASTARTKGKVGSAHRTNAQRRRTKAAKRASGDLDFGARYGDIEKYRKLCARVHKSTGGVCCCCLKRRSQEVHHTQYGRDRIGKTVFPLCKRCHDQKAHSEENWCKDKRDPVWGNKNTQEFSERLRLGYRLLLVNAN